MGSGYAEPAAIAPLGPAIAHFAFSAFSAFFASSSACPGKPAGGSDDGGLEEFCEFLASLALNSTFSASTNANRAFSSATACWREQGRLSPTFRSAARRPQTAGAPTGRRPSRHPSSTTGAAPVGVTGGVGMALQADALGGFRRRRQGPSPAIFVGVPSAWRDRQPGKNLRTTLLIIDFIHLRRFASLTVPFAPNNSRGGTTSGDV